MRPPTSIHLNCGKTKLMTTGSGGLSVWHHSQPLTPQTFSSRHALTHIKSLVPGATAPCAAEVTTGVHFLAQPLGSLSFANDFLAAAVSCCSHNSHLLQNGLNDPHSKVLIFKACSTQSLQHLRTSDVHCNVSLPLSPKQSLQSWSFAFAPGILEANHSFVAHLVDVQQDALHQHNHVTLLKLVGLAFSTGPLLLSQPLLPPSLAPFNAPPLESPCLETHSPCCFLQNNDTLSLRGVTAPLHNLLQAHTESHSNSSSVADAVNKANLHSFSSSLHDQTCQQNLQSHPNIAPTFLARAFPSIFLNTPHSLSLTATELCHTMDPQ